MKWWLMFGVAAVAVWAAACDEGDDDPTPAVEYFHSLRQLNAELERQVEDLPDDFLSIFPTGTLQEQLEALDRGTAIVQDIRSDYFAGLDGLEPPPEARALHDAYRAANVESFDHFDEILADARDSTSLEDYVGALFADAGEPVDTRVADACNALQELAASYAIDIDLECDERIIT